LAINSPRPRATSKKNRSAVIAARRGEKQEVQDLAGVDAHRLQCALARHRRQAPVLGVGAVEVVGHPPSQGIELDPGADLIAGGQILA